MRLGAIEAAGRAGVPFTSGVLVGIGETRRERLESLHALHELHLQYGHIQEIIIQNFRAKKHTAMQDVAEPSLEVRSKAHMMVLVQCPLFHGHEDRLLRVLASV